MKKIIKLFILFLLIVTLTGCMKINVNMEVSTQESMLKTMGTSKEEMGSSMEEQMLSEMDDANVEEVEKTIDGETWVGVFVTSEELYDIDIKEALEKDGDIITLTLPISDMIDEMDMDEIDDMGYSLDDLKASGLEMNFTIKMPWKVTSNVGEVNGDTVTIDLLEIMTENNNIEIKANTSQKVSSNSSDNMMLYMPLVLVQL